MQTSPIDDDSRKDNESEKYLKSYTKHLEERLRKLETEMHLMNTERIQLEQELHQLRNEIDNLREPALLTGTVIDALDDINDRAIIKSSNGPNFVVSVSRRINQKLKAGMEVALNQRNYSIMEILPSQIDPIIQAMELVDIIPDISYSDVGGLEDQILEVREAVELPLLKPELFTKVGISPPKGVLLHGPPGTGKTLLAKAVAHETKATFIRVIGSELVQKFIGEGARYVREVFELARKKAPTVLFIDELDAVAAERLEEATSGDREVQRTLMQLLSELDGFDNRGDVKIIGATNRIDILDVALLRPGRFDRIVELPLPNDKARESIFKIHMQRLNAENINITKLVEMTEGASGADIKAMCTEAGMFAIRNDSDTIKMDDFFKAIQKIMNKIKSAPVESNIFS